ncbi:carbohydrate esterase family 1 [Cordyceps militaris]|uniref:S-formylglutathione hydrolase n=1 Tax=Cordyceps militaris TaxID=73501 RepID=A0A2H4SL05_CORMI|nr:carbohydrate esterase family 1 [Cordyceps militaris]
MTFTTNASIRVFGGRLLKLTHQSTTTGTPMNLNLFIPASASAAAPAPVLLYLSGLTCTPDNVTDKGFLQAYAAPLGLALLYPDTSPRGLNLPGEDDAWDFGSAASFYIDSVRPPYDANYKMETYVARELPAHVFAAFAELDPTRVAISGHSMGGHGALTLFLKNPGQYKSVSAFAPITNPSRCPWGTKAFAGYLGDDENEWKKHDATELIKGWKGHFPCLIDVGLGDPFYKKGELLPENFEKAIKEAGISGATIRYQDLVQDYDHSYFFVQSFAEDHVKHAAKALGLL